MKAVPIISLAFAATAVASGPANAQEPIKVGVSVGLTGYAAAVDRAWRDGLEVAADYVNSKGGVLGRKIQLVIEDNKSEPQEAVTVYRKMISSDKVSLFISGCVSAGTFAAAPFVVRAQLPMFLCSILPPQPDQVAWSYSFLAPPRFEVERRYAYLKAKTEIHKAGVLHDPTPYANLQKDLAVKAAPDFGIEIPLVEQYKQDDADLSNQISKMGAAGAKAIIKIGLGGSTLTSAKNIKQLGLKTLLMGSVDDLAVFKPAGETLGNQFLFVASPAQVFDVLPEGALKQEISRFLPLWRAKHGDRDPVWAGKAWDAMMVAVAAIEKAQSVDGQKVRDAVETLPPHQGTGGLYSFSPTVHQGITSNPFFMATYEDGKINVQD